MMTTKEARELLSAHDADARALTRRRKLELVAIRRDALAADGVIWESGGPASKDELVRDILDRRYPVAQLNEATHVLWHAPSARWSACEHCQAKPSTTSVTTDQLVPGDVVLKHGMRVRIDEVREYRPAGANSAERAWCCAATVLNVTDVVQQHVIPASFLQTYGYQEDVGWTVEREDAWTVQGNTRAAWIVELPRPAAATRPEPPRLDGCTCEPVAGSHRPGCAWAMIS
ncbi:MAG TPA: hypothetical protein VGR98_12255 [Streptosporangiaceae bacterium]|nr:hypothetical protein [Streptosporangiaceae bacterium]